MTSILTQERIANKVRKIIQVNTEYYRKNILNILPHVLDFSYYSLKHSSPTLTGIEYGQIVNVVKSQTIVLSSLEEAMRKIRRVKTPASNVLFVNDARYGTYIIAKNYDSIQRTMSSILKQISSSAEFTGTNERGVTLVNIGHIASDELDQTRTPLAEKLQAALNAIPFSTASAKILGYLDRLYNEHTFEATYAFKRENFDQESFNKILGKGSVLVSLQTAEFNNELAVLVESKIEREVKEYLNSSEFITDLPTDIGSNSILEDIVAQIKAVLTGKVFKSSHSAHKPIKDVKKFTTKNNSVPVTKVDTPKIKNITSGRNISLTGLLTLLNFHLHDVVAANMGGGNERQILNYRTGRLATSTKVERLSQSREGMITAFYSYMKNPYATFSEGGKQQYPKSRDPKLLISKSIRQIAATIVANRMRAVLV